MNIVIIGFKLSVGNRLMMNSLTQILKAQGHQVTAMGDEQYQPVVDVDFHRVSDASSYFTIMKDTMNICKIYSIANTISKLEPDICYFISSHSLNFMVSVLLRIINRGKKKIVIASHIHDPIPHSNQKAAIPTFISQWLQVKTSDRIVVYGELLKKHVCQYYQYNEKNILVTKHTVYRDSIPESSPIANPLWFSLLGRMEFYKGIDIFLKAAIITIESIPNAKFTIAGNGDLSIYRELIDSLGTSLTVINREISDEETDSIMQSSWATILPYRDATQSGVIPISYYNACPVILSDVGSLGELVVQSETGFKLKLCNPEELSTCMTKVHGNYELRKQLGSAAFSYMKKELMPELNINRLMNSLVS
jgi:glycosyltransferase involved in cell wall biosynthesis